MPRKILSFPQLLFIIGSACILSAVFVERLDLDRSAGWGKIRITLLVFGIALTIGAALAWRYSDKMHSADHWLRSFSNDLRGASLSVIFRDYWFALPICGLVILVYIWFVSSGTWTTWTSPTHYYADLARGLKGGHLYLATKVNPKLLTSPNPYEPLPNGASQGPLDLSYYKGKYYLPWGPTPALVALLIHSIFNWWVGDLYLVFGFLSGLLLVQCLLLVSIWRRYYATLPKWILWMAVLLIGIAGPPLFMLSSYQSARN